MNKMISLKVDVTLSRDDLSKYLCNSKGEPTIQWAGRDYPMIDDGMLDSDIEEVRNGNETVVYTQIYVDVPVESLTFEIKIVDCSVLNADLGTIELGGITLDEINTSEIPTFPFDHNFEIYNNDDVVAELYKFFKNRRYM